MGSLDRSGDILAQRERLANEFFEPALSRVGLAEYQIDRYSELELTGALETVEDALREPAQFGELNLEFSGSVGIGIVRSQGVGHVTVGVMPILLERKARILQRMQAIADENSSRAVQEIVEQVPEERLRTALSEQISAFEQRVTSLRDREIETVQQAGQERVQAAADMEAARMKLEGFERRSAVWQKWLARESVATIMGAIFLVVAGVALVVAMFTHTHVPEMFSSSFLLVLGYFFGHASSRNDP